MRPIDADVFKTNMDFVCTMGGLLEPVSTAITEYIKNQIDAQTTIDAIDVVRCKDCKYFDSSPSCTANPYLHDCKYPVRKTKRIRNY